jgi:hypothetical protein
MATSASVDPRMLFLLADSLYLMYLKPKYSVWEK